MTRTEAIQAIRAALRSRSTKPWTVCHDGDGWIVVTAPPRRCDRYGVMTDADRAELGQLLGLGRHADRCGELVAAGDDYYAEYIDRANGRTPAVYGRPYWD